MQVNFWLLCHGRAAEHSGTGNNRVKQIMG
jgi:hypothetical protein